MTRQVPQALRARWALARWQVSLAGAGAVLLAALSVQPLLDGGWWIPRTVLAIGAVVVVGMASRALRLPAALHPVLEAVALLLVVTAQFAGGSAVWGFLPGPAAISDLQDLAQQGRAFAETTMAPAPLDLGLLMLVVAGIGLIALVVDTLAAGLDLPGLTLAPLAALFAVPWAINRGSAPGWTFAAAALAWLAVLAATQRDRTAQWSPLARPGSTGAGMALAVGATALAIAAGGLTTLRGTPAEPIGGSGAGSGSGTVEVDALVSLRRSIVANDDRVVLTYATTAPRPDYLRLAVLTQFDGETWTPAASGPETADAPPDAAGAVGSSGPAPQAEYRIDVGPLTGSTLPSPAGTVQSLNDWPVAWDRDSLLPRRADGQTIDGTRVGLLVSPPTIDATSLRVASTEVGGRTPPDEQASADPSPLVGTDLTRLAQQVTRGATTPFDRAVALQRWFAVDGGFRYSTDIEGGSSGDALATFLEERVGYCEQFAATMALMARSLGIPARVVVGFTQGRPAGGQWVVRGTDAHAWPELWMGAAGWVRFEPTPGAPTATVPSYSRPQDAGASESASASASATQEDAQPSAGPSGRLPDAADGTAAVVTDSRGRWWGLLPVLVLVLLLVPALVRVRRRRRRMAAGDADGAYAEVVDTMIDLGLGSELATPRATLSSAGATVGGLADGPAREALDRLLRSVEWQRFGQHLEASGPGRTGRGGTGRRVRETGQPGAAPSSGGGTSASAGTLLDPGAGKPSEDRGQLVEDQGPATRRGALAGDVRLLRRALRARAGTGARLRAALLPRSVLGSWLGRS